MTEREYVEELRRSSVAVATYGSYLIRVGTRQQLEAYGYPQEFIDAVLAVREVRLRELLHVIRDRGRGRAGGRAVLPDARSDRAGAKVSLKASRGALLEPASPEARSLGVGFAKLCEWIAGEATFQLFTSAFYDDGALCYHRCCGVHRVGSRPFNGCLECSFEREQFAIAYFEDPPLYIAAIEAAIRVPSCLYAI